MEAVVLHRVGFLAYFCPKQGHDFKLSAAPLYPNMGQVASPRGGATIAEIWDASGKIETLPILQIFPCSFQTIGDIYDCEFLLVGKIWFGRETVSEYMNTRL